MKFFIELKLTIVKGQKRFTHDSISWYFTNEDKAAIKYEELKEKCQNYEVFAGDWKYLNVLWITKRFDD